MSSSSSSNPSCISNSISSPNSSASINHSTLTYRQKYKLWTESFKAKLKVLEERYDESLSLDLDEKQRIELKRKNAMVRDRLGELSCYWVNENLFLTTIESFKPTTPEEVESLEKTVFRRLRRVTNGKNFLSKMEEIEDAKKRLPDEDLKIRGKYSHAYYEARHDPAQYSPAEIASVRAPFVAVDKEYDETMKQLARLEQVLEPNEKKSERGMGAVRERGTGSGRKGVSRIACGS